jgi:uncharacterized phage protein gp47/JayE
MAVAIPSRAALIAALANAVQTRDPAIETSFGPVKDIVIDPVSLIVRDAYVQLSSVQASLFLANADALDPAILDQVGESYGVVREGATSTTGSAFFRTPNKPATDIIVLQGSPVATISTPAQPAPISFVTTKTVTLPASNALAFFDPISGNYEIEAPIKSLIPGVAGRVAANTIRTLQRSIPGISAVTNKSPTSGGQDAESNTAYAARILSVIRGSIKGTATGLERFSQDDARVLGAAVVRSPNPLLIRAESVANAVDVYIMGQDPVTVTETILPFSSSDFFFANEPLIFPGPIVSVTATSPSGTLVEGTDYFLVPDPITGGTTAARHRIQWNRSSTNLPTPGSGSVSVQYNYDKLIQDLQTSLAVPGNDLLMNILFSRAQAVALDIIGAVKMLPGFDAGTVQGDIVAAVNEFITTAGLGVSINPSDLDVVIRTVPGVDFTILPFTRLAVLGQTTSGTVPIALNQYATIASANIVITVNT